MEVVMRGWWLGLGFLGACAGGGPEVAPVDEGDVAPEARVLFDAADGSIHELVVCGGMQRGFVLPMALRVALSADGMLDEQAYAEVEAVALAFGYPLDGGGFERDGVDWQIPMGDQRFGVRFVRDGVPVAADPFVLDSYVRGVTASSSRTWDEILGAPDEPVTFAYHWEEEGELAHLLEPLTNPIVVEASLWDLAELALGSSDGGGDFGSFESLGDLAVEGSVPFVDEVGGVSVTYDARLDGDVRGLSTGGAAAIALHGLAAEHGGYTLRAVRVDVEELPGALAGELELEIRGPGVVYGVVADFGEGSAYPETRWTERPE